MIFVILGSQKNQFNRLLKALDGQVAAGEIKERIFAQTGYSDYEPVNYEFRHFLDHDEFNRVEEEAELVITHGGTGAIMGALKKGKKVIAVPRRFDLGEHNDDHQIQVVSQLAQSGLITCCENTDELAGLVRKVMEAEEPAGSRAYRSNTEGYLKDIEEFINSSIK